MIREVSLQAPLGETAHVVVEAYAGCDDALLRSHVRILLDDVVWQLERAVRVARMHEATARGADGVLMTLDLKGAHAAGIPTDARGRALELAVVVADRLARKVPIQIAGGDDGSTLPVRVVGQFEDPHLLSGALKGGDQAAGPDEAGLCARWMLDNGAVRLLEPLWSSDRSEVGRAEVLFPVLPTPDLRSVEVFARRAPPQLGKTFVIVAPSKGDPKVTKKDISGFKARVEDVLGKARSAGEEAVQNWLTTVVFKDGLPSGESWNLALAMADRIARGVEWPMGSGGRLIATGKINTVKHPGAVEGVKLRLSAGGETKLSLLQGDDVLLLPASMKTDADVQTLLQQEKPPTVLFLDHIVPASLRAASPPP